MTSSLADLPLTAGSCRLPSWGVNRWLAGWYAAWFGFHAWAGGAAWHFFVAGEQALSDLDDPVRGGIHLYAALPQIEIGPVALFVAWLGEIARRTQLAAVVATPVRLNLAVSSVHLDDVLAFLFATAAVLTVVRQRLTFLILDPHTGSLVAGAALWDIAGSRQRLPWWTAATSISLYGGRHAYLPPSANGWFLILVFAAVVLLLVIRPARVASHAVPALSRGHTWPQIAARISTKGDR